MSPRDDAPGEVFDPGLQPERTLLAWRRTCLAFVVVSLIGMRFTLPVLGGVAVLAGILGAGLAVLAYVLAATGYRSAHRSLHEHGGMTRGGFPMLAATAAVLTVGTLCALFLGAGVIEL